MTTEKIDFSKHVSKSIEARTLQCLERIEQLLLAHWAEDDHPLLRADGTPADASDVVDKIAPTQTPFMQQAAKKAKRK